MSENAAKAGVNEPKGGSIIAGRYQIDRLIARGGMASVYLAHQIKLNRPVALKILTPPTDMDESAAFEERFRLEAETLASLDHPNIVILHDFGELDDGRFFLAMEYVDGPRLSDILKSGPLDHERALHLVGQVATALRYAHKRGVVHRDLKPSNLLVKTDDDGTEQLKVVDFGLVKLTEGDQSITRAGLILGSPHCMSPEQVKGLDVDHRADIYAIGVLLFRVLTGQYPFHGTNSAATMIAHLNQQTPTFFSVAPQLVLPDGLEDIVRKCLSKNPGDRYPDTGELLTDLATCMSAPPDAFRTAGHTVSTIQRSVRAPTGTPAPQRTGPGNKLWIPLVGIGVLIAMVGVAVVSVAITSIVTTQSSSVVPGTQRLPPLSVEPAPVPAPIAEPEPIAPEPVDIEPEPVDIEPEPVAPEPVAPKPAPPSKPRPRPTPKPVAPEPVAPKPVAPEPVEPAPVDPPQPKSPEGYMGLPDDFQ